MSFVNYYDILEINENASQEVIKAAYRALALKHHPDTANSSANTAHVNMVLINEAYSVLSNETTRREYDQRLQYEKKQYRDYTPHSSKVADDRSNNHSCDQNQTSEEEENKSSDESSKEDSTEPPKDNTNKDHQKDSFASKLGRFFADVGREVLGELGKNAQIVDNAYISGSSMDESSLVWKFKRSKGFERSGYAKAMVEKGLLRVNDEGKYEPTFLLKKYW